MATFFWKMKTPQLWRTSRVYVMVVLPYWRYLMSWRHSVMSHDIDINPCTNFGANASNGLAVRALTNWQTDGKTHRNTGPILLPRPLMREVKIHVIPVRMDNCGTSNSPQTEVQCGQCVHCPTLSVYTDLHCYIPKRPGLKNESKVWHESKKIKVKTGICTWVETDLGCSANRQEEKFQF